MVKSLEENFKQSSLNVSDKLKNFTRYVPRRDIATFLNRYEIYKKISNQHGAIIECGVNLGFGLFSWLHFLNIFEPYNSSRYIIGFDTFDGFTGLNKHKDQHGIYLDKKKNWKEFRNKQSYKELINSLSFHENERPTKHLPKVEVIKGDAKRTIPKFVKKNPHLIISLLHIDFDIYSPTKSALKHFIPRMAKGSIIAFDDLGAKEGPGETLAMLEELNIKNFKINRNKFDSFLCYIEL